MKKKQLKKSKFWSTVSGPEMEVSDNNLIQGGFRKPILNFVQLDFDSDKNKEEYIKEKQFVLIRQTEML